MRALLVAILALPTLLAAQTAATAAKPHLHIDTVGPEGWRLRLGPTNLGGMLASEKGRELWQPTIEQMFGIWRQNYADDATFAAAKERLVGHSGRIQLGAWFSDSILRDSTPPRVVLVLDGDGRTDLPKLAADLRALQEQQKSGEWRQRVVAGQTLTTNVDGDTVTTAPVVHGQSVVMVTAPEAELEATFRDALSLCGDGKPPTPTTPALRLTLDTPALIDAFPEARETAQATMAALGFNSLGKGEMTVTTAGPSVQVELALNFRSQERGIFGAFLPNKATVPALRALAGAGSYKLGHFDWVALFDSVKKAVEIELDEEAGKLDADMRKELGIDLRADLLVHTTTEAGVFVGPLADIEQPERATWALVVRLQDEAKFRAGLDTLLQHSKPLLQREAAEQVDGIEIRRYGNMLGYDLHLAVGHGHFVVAGGAEANPWLQKTLAQLKVAAPATGAPVAGGPAAGTPATTSLPNGFPGQRYLPAGLNGIGSSELDSLMALPLGAWAVGLDLWRGGPDLDAADDPEAQAARAALLREHKLATVHTATGFANDTWRWRLYW